MKRLLKITEQANKIIYLDIKQAKCRPQKIPYGIRKRLEYVGGFHYACRVAPVVR